MTAPQLVVATPGLGAVAILGGQVAGVDWLVAVGVLVVAGLLVVARRVWPVERHRASRYGEAVPAAQLIEQHRAPAAPERRAGGVRWAVSSRETRVHLSRGDGEAVCEHPLRGAWLHADDLDGVICPGEHVPCSSCVAIDGTPRRFAQALRASGPPTSAKAPQWELPDSMQETRPLPRLIEAYAEAANDQGAWPVEVPTPAHLAIP
ncbi:hypothetical protein [Saccharopolyspora cebuensis]|uniref:Uncharacterized protein n=1 Tax=Saccharopolyspora cebuensis TaxID=418759 RepID=A0ABV4CK05_9PSEU